jgi:hypothetical protein
MIDYIHPNLPEELPEYINSPRSARAWIDDRLYREGYRILIEPNPEDLPESLSDYSMDMVAIKDSLSVAVVVRRVNGISDNNLALMDAVRDLPGWSSLMIAIPIKESRRVSASEKMPVEVAA